MMRMLQKRYIGLVLLLLMAVTASAQKAERDFIRKGNRFFKDSVYVNAEVNYRKALEVNPQSTVSMFNLEIHWRSRISCKRLWNNMLLPRKWKRTRMDWLRFIIIWE